LLPSGRFPIAVVLVYLPPDAVDVNVHPAKTEIRFRDGRAAFSAVERAVRRTVVGGAPVRSLRVAEDGTSWAVPGQHPSPPTGEISDREPTEQPSLAEADDERPSVEGGRLPILRVVGQVGLAYIVAEGPDGLYLIDQHAAHERIMYERFKAGEQDSAKQQLLEPVQVRLTPPQFATAKVHAARFARLGLVLEPFGSDSVLVRTLPEGLGASDVGGLISAVVDEAAAGRGQLEEAFEERLVRAVCKRATVKAGQALDLEEMSALVRDLEKTESPRTCPHGRPTTVVLTGPQLARLFGRA
jgi:DNA mismatch repair protein MutL